MVFVDKSFEQMQDEIGFERFTRYDIISPARNPEKFRGTLLRSVRSFNDDYVNQLVESMRAADSDLKDLLCSVIGEVALNVHERAHRCDDGLDYSLKIADGSDGYILRVRDSGEGFDYKNKIEKLRNGEKYWDRGGMGLLALNQKGIQASYEGSGSVVNIMVGKGSARD